jgi:hypothetical protein
MRETEQDWFDDLHDFSVPEKSEEAFEKLVTRTRPILLDYLHRKEGRVDDHEDIVSDCFARIWQNRTRLSFERPSSWLAFTMRAVTNLQTNHRMGFSQRHILNDDLIAQTQSSVDFVNAIEGAMEWDELSQHADDCWLGPKPADFKKRLYFAVLLYWDGADFANIAEQVRLADLPHEFQQPEKLIPWVSEDRVIRSLCKLRLGFEPHELLGYVLGGAEGRKDVPHKKQELERSVAYLRYGTLESRQTVVAKLQREHDTVEIEAILDQFESQMPFQDNMRRLWDALRKCDTRERALSADGLWKRLVFFYHAYELSHEDCNNWLAPASAIAGFQFSKTTTHGWISNRRLHKELRKYLEQEVIADGSR